MLEIPDIAQQFETRIPDGSFVIFASIAIRGSFYAL